MARSIVHNSPDDDGLLDIMNDCILIHPSFASTFCSSKWSGNASAGSMSSPPSPPGVPHDATARELPIAFLPLNVPMSISVVDSCRFNTDPLRLKKLPVLATELPGLDTGFEFWSLPEVVRSIALAAGGT